MCILDAFKVHFRLCTERQMNTSNAARNSQHNNVLNNIVIQAHLFNYAKNMRHTSTLVVTANIYLFRTNV